MQRLTLCHPRFVVLLRTDNFINTSLELAALSAKYRFFFLMPPSHISSHVHLMENGSQFFLWSARQMKLKIPLYQVQNCGDPSTLRSSKLGLVTADHDHRCCQSQGLWLRRQDIVELSGIHSEMQCAPPSAIDATARTKHQTDTDAQVSTLFLPPSSPPPTPPL